MPEGTLVALVSRGAGTIVPGGSTVLKEGDRLTVIGDPAGLKDFTQRFTRRRSGPDSNS